MRVWPVMDTDVIAWAATIDEPAGTAALALREVLSGWFGAPLKTRVPIIDRPYRQVQARCCAQWLPATSDRS